MQFYFTEDKETDCVSCHLGFSKLHSMEIKKQIMQLYFTKDKEATYVTLFQEG